MLSCCPEICFNVVLLPLDSLKYGLLPQYPLKYCLMLPLDPLNYSLE